jgi:hypothetical protein
VSRLNAGSKTKKLNAPKAQIMLSRAPQENFEDAVGLINVVSGFQGGGGGSSKPQGSGGGKDSDKEVHWKYGEGFIGGKGKGGGLHKRKHGNAEVQDWHYLPKTYAQLNPARKQKPKSLCTPRDGLLDNRQAAQLAQRSSALKSALLLQGETHEEDQEREPGASTRNANCNHSI